jgi:aquaporin Z
MKKCKYSKLSNYILEGIGSFLLVLFAAGAVMSNAFYDGTIGQLMGGFSSGLILFILISSLGKYTRGHVNPAVTLIEFRLGYIGKRTAFFYIIFQIIGSILAGYFLKFTIGNYANIGANLPLLKSELNNLLSFFTEFILSALLAAVIIRVAYVEKLSLTFLAASCGLLVCVEVIVFGAITGAAMNPIRAIGPHFAANFPGELWIYIFGPTIGFLFVAEVYIFFSKKIKKKYNR